MRRRRNVKWGKALSRLMKYRVCSKGPTAWLWVSLLVKTCRPAGQLVSRLGLVVRGNVRIRCLHGTRLASKAKSLAKNTTPAILLFIVGNGLPRLQYSKGLMRYRVRP